MVGSGSIIEPGTVITNAHVIYDKSTSSLWTNIRVYLKPDFVTGKFSTDLVNRHKATVIAYDTELDLAVLKVEGLPSDNGIIEIGNSEEIKIGEEVVAIGHPEQGGLWTLTYGRISGEIKNQTNISGKNVFQTDTSLNRGNSGGPLLDRRGYMIGINSAAARLGEDNMPISGINFAIKSSVVKKWLDRQRIFIAYGKKALYSESTPQVVASENITPKTALKETKPDKVKTTIMEPQPVQKKADAEPKVEPKKEAVEPKKASTPQVAATEDVTPKTTYRETKTDKVKIDNREPQPVEKKAEAEQKVESKTEAKAEPKKEAAEPKKTSTEDINPEVKRAEKVEIVEKQTKNPAEDNKIKKTETPKKIPSDTILTPKRPYRIEDLWAEVEKEMSDMMQEMRQRIER
jgi:serine protease Do